MIDADTLEIEVVNQSPKTSSYFITVALLDDTGQRLGDSTEILDYGTPETSDYSISVALVDADGIRRGSGFAFIEAVRPEETAPSDVFSGVVFASGLSCEVVAVDRTAST